MNLPNPWKKYIIAMSPNKNTAAPPKNPIAITIQNNPILIIKSIGDILVNIPNTVNRTQNPNIEINTPPNMFSTNNPNKSSPPKFTI